VSILRNLQNIFSPFVIESVFRIADLIHTLAERRNFRSWTISEMRPCFDQNNYVHMIWIQTEFYAHFFKWPYIYVRGGQLQMMHLLREAKWCACIRNRQISSNLRGALKTVLGLSCLGVSYKANLHIFWDKDNLNRDGVFKFTFYVPRES